MLALDLLSKRLTVRVWDRDKAVLLTRHLQEGTVRILTSGRQKKTMDISMAHVKPFCPSLGGKAVVVFGDNVGEEVEVQKAEGTEWIVLSSRSSEHYVVPYRWLCAKD